MGIDGIGKPPSIPPPSGSPGASGASEFKIPDAPGAERVASGDLGRLERGEIALDQYLDGRVSDATRHLEGRLPKAELDFVRQTLRAELESDPVLVELVRRATGQVPTGKNA